MNVDERIARLPNQPRRVAEYMRQFGWITPLDGFRDLGVTRLAARVHDLKGAGFTVVGEVMTESNRFGEAVHYKRYRLGDEPCFPTP